jgi:hypothetical protein
MQTDRRTINQRFSRHVVLTVVACLFAMWMPIQAMGQLAITEVLSSPSTNPIPRGDDYWELTNFGTNAVDLSSFRFRDEGGYPGSASLAILWSDTRTDGPSIDPGESILFVRRKLGLSTPDDFRRWWGDTQLSSSLKILFYDGYGFSNERDAVQLWDDAGGQIKLVDRVELFNVSSTNRGRSFTYDPATGRLDTFSQAGVDGAFQAATTTDVGSPGVTTGPVPLSLVEAPASAQVDGGMPVTFTVRAFGLPRPRYQWHFNGQPIPGAAGPSLIISDASGADVGEYTVEVSNGLTNVFTPPARLMVNLTPSCARIVRPPEDIIATDSGLQRATFQVEVRGFPVPTIHWQFNGADIDGATNATHSITNVNVGDAGLYCVRVANALCSTNACARLEVGPPPKLVITEVMANHSTNTTVSGHDDWWELTNMDTYTVNLRGYRFDDFPGVLEGAVVVTNNILLRPGQSMIWVSSMSPARFRRWWGEEYLPADLPIVSYAGNGLAASGDMIRLWNAAAVVNDDFIASVSFVHLDNEGFSLRFDDGECEFGCPSVEGENGAFRAVESDDIGSPGWISNDQRIIRPRVTSIRYDSAGVTLTWNTQTNRIYELQYRDRLAAQEWTLLRRLTANGGSLTTIDSTTTATAQRFYRVELLPP